MVPEINTVGMPYTPQREITVIPPWLDEVLPEGSIPSADEHSLEVLFGNPNATAHPNRLPENAFRAARVAGATEAQLQKAEEMRKLGLFAAAERQALCGVIGHRQVCSDTTCGKEFYTSYRCKCRYCPECAPRQYGKLFGKYIKLRPIAKKLVDRSDSVIAKLDFTTKKLDRMPTREEVREFNACIKRFCRRLERELEISRKEYGLIYCDEFGGGENTNLHAHAIYVGPRLPRPKRKSSQRLGAC